MFEYGGDDLLRVFSCLSIDMRNLSPNVIKAWFDTDCKNTKNLLNWLCCSLSSVNYVSPLEKAEFEELREHLDSETCINQLKAVNPNFLSVFETGQNLEDILLIEDEIYLLEEENGTLDNLLDVYENLDSNLSLELTHKTSREIQLNVESKKSQESCIILSKNLDELNICLQKQLIKYDPESHFVNFVDVKEYQEIIENLNSFIIPLLEINKNRLESSDDNFTDALETARKRILHSHQIYLANKVEIEKLNEIYDYLIKTNISENIVSWTSLNNRMNMDSKEMYKKRLCDALDGIALQIADQYLRQTKIRYVQKELEDFQIKSLNISKMLECVTKFLAYFTLTNSIQFEEKKDIECINSFYQKMLKYINEDLHKCRYRTGRMRHTIEEYQTYLSGPDYDKMKLVTSIAKILSSDSHSIESAFEAVYKFKTELDLLQSQIFCMDIKSEKEKINLIHEDIKVLQDFLISGPTNRIVLIPLDLQNAWFDIEGHLKKESASVARAVQIPQTTRKGITKAQNYMKQLWMNFLTNPSKVDTILKQAEEDFKQRTAQYF